MADRTVRVRFDGSATGLQRAARNGQNAVGKFSVKAVAFGTAIGAGIAIAARAIFQFGKDSVGAFLDAEQSQAKLQDAFARFPKLADTNITKLRGLNTQLARKTKFDDDSIASGQAVLAQFKLTGRQIENLTPLVADYAAKTGKDLPNAAKTLGKAFLGNTRALKELGISYKSTGNQAKDTAAITQLLRDKVGGFAEKQGKTAAGRLQILANRFGEVKETIGKFLLPVLLRLGTIALAMIAWIERNQKVLIPLIVVLKNFGLAVRDKVIVLLTKARELFNKIRPVLENFGRLVGPLISGAIKNLKSAWDSLRPALSSLMPVLKVVGIIIGVVILVAVLAVIAAFRLVAFVIKNVTVPVLKLLLTVGKFVAEKILGAWSPVWNFFTKTAPNMFNRLKSATLAVKNFIVSKWNALIGFFRGLPGRVTSAVGDLFGGFRAAFRNALNWIIDKWNNFHIPPIRILGREVSPRIDFPDLPRFHRGGIVPGAFSKNVLALLRGGERVLTREQQTRGGDTFHVTVQALSNQFSIRQVMQDLALHGAH